ncbi:MAG: hypothetical protein ACXVCP_11720 [Bdellovibrio sp.]
MILMWLGSYVLMMFGLIESQKQLGSFFSNAENDVLKKGIVGTTAQMFFRSFGISLMNSSPVKTLTTGLAVRNASPNAKGGILLMCLSTLGAWWILLLGLLFLGVSGLFVLGFCSIGLVTVFRNQKSDMVLKWLFAIGVFLVGGELMLKNSSVIQTLLGQSELVFFLADGRFVSVLTILFITFLLSLLIRIEFWSVPLVLGLLITNTLSFNGALGCVVGERIGQLILFWWKHRELKQNQNHILRQFTVVSILSLLVGFIFAGETRSLFYFGLSSDLSSLQDKSFQFVLLFAVMLFFQWLGQMVWGHFASN